MRKYLLPLAAGALVAAAAYANAATTSATFNVSVTVAKSCSVTATDIDFGTVTNLSSQTATGTVTANCSTGSPYTIGLTASTVDLVGATSTIIAGLVLAGAGSFTGTGADEVLTVTATLPTSLITPDNDTYTGSATVDVVF